MSESTTEQDGVVIYTSPFCGFCAAAKALLKSKDVDYAEIDILADPQSRTEMMERSRRRTVPQIFIASEHIGGFDDLKALDDAGELDPLLAALKAAAT